MRNQFEFVLGVAAEIDQERQAVLADQKKERQKELKQIDQEGKAIGYKVDKPVPPKRTPPVGEMKDWDKWLSFILEQSAQGKKYSQIAAEISKATGLKISPSAVAGVVRRRGLQDEICEVKGVCPSTKMDWKKHERFVVDGLVRGDSVAKIAEMLSEKLGQVVTLKSMKNAIGNHRWRVKAREIQVRNKSKNESKELQNVSK